MRLPALLVSDIHLTANPKDAYRWCLFPWLREQLKKQDVATLCILGDITDAKDSHPAELVNKIVHEVKELARLVDDVYILCGNHDYLREGSPFFGFLSEFDNVHFISKPFEPDAESCTSLFLPHTRTPSKDWAGYNFEHYQYVFMHQTVSGSVASNGMVMDGEKVPDMSAAWKVYSGDIHVPQIINGVEYVGSPYHVHFGDKFNARCVLLPRRGPAEDLHLPCIKRYVLTVASLAELRTQRRRVHAGDQVKLRISLAASERHEWARIRREACALLQERGVEVHGVELVSTKPRTRLLGASVAAAKRIDPPSAVLRHVQREEWSAEALDIALDLMEKS